jgi:hypothetical protein
LRTSTLPRGPCRQFHQRFTRGFFVQNFGAKNYKAENISGSVKHSLVLFLAPKYQRKIFEQNVDEIDTLSTVDRFQTFSCSRTPKQMIHF